MIHIACCFDERFEIPFVVLVSSIQRYATSQVTIHALHDGPLRHAERLVRDTGLVRCTFTDIAACFRRFRVRGPQSAVVFARLALAELLPGIDRVIYLDADMIVRRDLGDLFQVDLHGRPLGAAIDIPLATLATCCGVIEAHGRRFDVSAYLRDVIGVADPLSYFNSGVMVIDLPAFSAPDTAAAIARVLERSTPARLFNDQDAINIVFRGHIAALDPRWNVLQNTPAQASDPDMPAAVRTALALSDDPWIIHFAGAKPWNAGAAPGPWGRLFWDQAAWHGAVEWPLLLQFWRSIGNFRLGRVERFLRKTQRQGPRDGLAGVPRALVRHCIEMWAQRPNHGPAGSAPPPCRP